MYGLMFFIRSTVSTMFAGVSHGSPSMQNATIRRPFLRIISAQRSTFFGCVSLSYQFSHFRVSNLYAYGDVLASRLPDQIKCYVIYHLRTSLARKVDSHFLSYK